MALMRVNKPSMKALPSPIGWYTLFIRIFLAGNGMQQDSGVLSMKDFLITVKSRLELTHMPTPPPLLILSPFPVTIDGL